MYDEKWRKSEMRGNEYVWIPQCSMVHTWTRRKVEGQEQERCQVFAPILYMTLGKGTSLSFVHLIQWFLLTTSSVPCCTFSQDTSLMAAGFSESYIRIWSLKGEKLRGFRNDFQPSSVKDGDLPIFSLGHLFITLIIILPSELPP